jgi:uncharacterized damage-inducible protein DinB
MTPALTLEELLGWSDETTRQWITFLAAYPAVQQLPCGIYGTGSVLGLARHIVAVELRYSQRFFGLPVTTYEEIPENSLETLATLHAESIERFRALLSDAAQDWAEEMEFKTLTAGTIRATRRKVLAHALLHAIRHWAQVATLARAAGYPANFLGDLLASSALR